MKLIIMRGCPGSGKSYTARNLIKEFPSNIILSTDNFFNSKGEYKFDPTKLNYYHRMNQENAEKHMRLATKLILIDNTNIRLRDFKPYLESASRWYYSVEYREPDSPWWLKISPLLPIKDLSMAMFCAKEFCSRCEHNVPDTTIAHMLMNWEKV